MGWPRTGWFSCTLEDIGRERRELANSCVGGFVRGKKRIKVFCSSTYVRWKQCQKTRRLVAIFAQCILMCGVF
jgi:hypothetical protein